ncbi:uncharacterized protein LOC126355711 [Schistocerca gregaria]|uniref:uncharacterized protein LOC126355711 n=1 Tax=Schistocerca gregaria TaxID=7010 RepID=UPI00211ED53F|nr:uncharacterized protein LOC126355711 [Schistocerca gregaria]
MNVFLESSNCFPFRLHRFGCTVNSLKEAQRGEPVRQLPASAASAATVDRRGRIAGGYRLEVSCCGQGVGRSGHRPAPLWPAAGSARHTTPRDSGGRRSAGGDAAHRRSTPAGRASPSCHPPSEAAGVSLLDRGTDTRPPAEYSEPAVALGGRAVPAGCGGLRRRLHSAVCRRDCLPACRRPPRPSGRAPKEPGPLLAASACSLQPPASSLQPVAAAAVPRPPAFRCRALPSATHKNRAAECPSELGTGRVHATRSAEAPPQPPPPAHGDKGYWRLAVIHRGRRCNARPPAVSRVTNGRALYADAG